MTKSFKNFLAETTVPEHLHFIPNRWDHQSKVDSVTRDKIDAAMGGKSFISFPLESGDSDADVDVVDHLTKHGWDITDYRGGIASKKTQVGNPARGIPMRDKMLHKRISQVLEETSAPDYIKQSYQHDPARAASKAPQGHHVVITTSPLGIAGCSTGTGWNSCMNLEGGSNKHYLQHESENGTHVAYLVPHDDEGALKYGEPDRPISRISLRPFHAGAFSYSGSTDTIFRPSKQGYGADSSDFRGALENWANRSYPAKSNEPYNLNQFVYRGDDHQSLKFPTNQELEDRIDKHRSMVFFEALPKASIDHVIDYAKEKYKDDVGLTNKFIDEMAQHKNLDASHVSKLLSMNYTSSAPLADKHGDKFSTAEIEKFYPRNKWTGYTPEAILSSKKLPDSVLDDIPVREYSMVRKSKLKERHIDKIVDAHINDQTDSNRNLKIKDFADKLSSDHISKLIAHNSAYAMDLSDAKNFTKEHYNSIPKNFLFSGSVMSKSRHASPDDIGDDSYSGMRISALMANPHLSDDDNKKVKDALVYKLRHAPTLNILPRMDDVIQNHDIMQAPQSIPEKISKHFTAEDYSGIANKAMGVPFGDKAASNKYLDAVHDKITNLDNYISEHINNKKAIDSSYKPESDHVVSAAKDVMLKHIVNYRNNMQEHIDNHVSSDYAFVKDVNELDNIHKRIYDLDSLNNYNRRKNQDDSDHYDDHFGDMKNDLDNLK